MQGGTGLDGYKGDLGPRGEKGETGVKGPRGEEGRQGPKVRCETLLYVTIHMIRTLSNFLGQIEGCLVLTALINFEYIRKIKMCNSA